MGRSSHSPGHNERNGFDTAYSVRRIVGPYTALQLLWAEDYIPPFARPGIEMRSEGKELRLAWRKRSTGHVPALGPSQAFVIDTQVIVGNEVLKAVVIYGIYTGFAPCGVDLHLLDTRRLNSFMSVYRAQSHMHQSDRTIQLESQFVPDTSHRPEPWNAAILSLSGPLRKPT